MKIFCELSIVCVSDIRTRIEDVESEGFLEDSPKPELKLVIRDAAIAISYMLLEAQHLKLGTCWTGWYEQEKMRKPLNEIIRYERW